MKIIKKKFFNFLIINVIILTMFFSQLIAKNDIPGRKIKKQKNNDKRLIKKEILKTAAIFLDNNFNKESTREKNVNIDNLSQSAQDRYKLENNFIQGTIQRDYNKIIDVNKKNTENTLLFLKKNYNVIKDYLEVHNSISDSFLDNIILLLLNRYISQGYSLKDALMAISVRLKKNPVIFEGIIQLLENINNSNLYDDAIITILKNTLIYNGSDKIETDRAINRFYNYANRHPVVLVIQQYNKNDFTIKENNSTYGELSPSKDIYQKLIYDKKKLENSGMRNYFQLSRRDMPEKKPIKIMYNLVVPNIRSNIIEYMTIDTQTMSLKKIETIINNLDRDYFYSLSVITEKELNYLV